MTQQPSQQPSPDPIGALVRRIREHELLLSQSDLAWLTRVPGARSPTWRRAASRRTHAPGTA